ncbi:flagellar hook assembly protein FlgD [Thermodesulfobacteriota bacterium]
MLDGIQGIPVVQEPSPYGEQKTADLGRDDFLKMFLAQLTHQDPLNPMEPSEFSSQMAQFSSLEQLLNVNTNLENIKSMQDESGRFLALDFIGKDIVAEGNLLTLSEGQTALGGFTLEDDAECTVVVIDEGGNTVRRIPLGVVGAGPYSFEWDGHNDAGNPVEPGIYGFDITAKTESGQYLAVTTQITGQVSRVNLEGSQPLLYIEEIPIPLSKVVDIKAPAAPADPQ